MKPIVKVLNDKIEELEEQAEALREMHSVAAEYNLKSIFEISNELKDVLGKLAWVKDIRKDYV